MSRLRAIGTRIALDDFGTGYSFLSFLHSFPFTRIKTDRSFIQGFGVNLKSTMIVQAIMRLCNSFGFEVNAEGIETEKQAALLKSEGSVQAQGYWFSRTRPADEVANLITKFL